MRLTIIGFGNQAKAWALNLKDSKFPVRVALRPDSPSFESAEALGLETVEIGSSAFFEDRYFVLLTPDDSHHDFMQTNGNLFRQGSVILYNHGFSMMKSHFENQFPSLRHVLFAVKAIGSEIRKQYKVQGKLGGVYSLEFIQDKKSNTEEWLQKLAVALGLNMGIYPTTFENETKADLYSEQGLLCSLIPYTAERMFQHLIDAGVEKELAYFEVWHELKLVVMAMVDKGPEGFYDLISPNALVGSEKGFLRLITPDFEARLKGLLLEIESGQFQKQIDEISADDLRQKVRSRWQKTSLMKTFLEMNKEKL